MIEVWQRSDLDQLLKEDTELTTQVAPFLLEVRNAMLFYGGNPDETSDLDLISIMMKNDDTTHHDRALSGLDTKCVTSVIDLVNGVLGVFFEILLGKEASNTLAKIIEAVSNNTSFILTASSIMLSDDSELVKGANLIIAVIIHM